MRKGLKNDQSGRKTSFLSLPSLSPMLMSRHITGFSYLKERRTIFTPLVSSRGLLSLFLPPAESKASLSSLFCFFSLTFMYMHARVSSEIFPTRVTAGVSCLACTLDISPAVLSSFLIRRGCEACSIHLIQLQSFPCVSFHTDLESC